MGVLKDRQAVTRALRNNFSEKVSARYERELWRLAKKLSEEFDNEVKDIYKKYAYEKVGELLTVETISQRKAIHKDIIDCVVDWDSAVYSEFRKQLEKETSQPTAGVKGEKCEYPCRNRSCRSKECYYYQLQTSKADEGFTTYVICAKCGTRYKFH